MARMVPGPDVTEFVKRMRALGATHVSVGDVTVTFAPPTAPGPAYVAPEAPALTDEERERELEALTYAHSEG